MMKKTFMIAFFAVYALPVSLFPLHPGASWKYVGLKGATVNTMLPLVGFSPDGIMVGTQTGIRNFEYGHWDTAAAYTTWSGLPVHDIIRIPGERLLAAMGNGSDSDGVYLGKVSAIGEPGTRWRFSLLAKCPLPTALAFSPLDGDCTGKLFLGNAEGVRSGLLCKDTLKQLAVVAGPHDPFGGFCRAMLVSSSDGMLYAGGRNHDRTGGMGGEAWILRGDASGMSALKKLDATSIIDLPPRIPDAAVSSSNRTMVVIGALDSGIQIFDSGTFKGRYPPPLQRDTVLSVAYLSENFGATRYTQMVAATPSGVYIQCPPDAYCVWTRLSSLPGVPRCLAYHQGTMVWAATDSGVYRYDNSTSAGRNNLTAASGAVAKAWCGEGKEGIIVRIENNMGRTCEFSLFDLRGRCLKSCGITKSRSHFPVAGKGIYFFKIALDNKVIRTGRVMEY
jgi:hypothetical protein